MRLTKVIRLLTLVIYSVCIFIISSILIYLTLPKIEDVHRIIKHPELYKGNIGIMGEVYKALAKKGSASFLILDCGRNSGCMTIPVNYKGESPQVGSKIFAYGKIKMARGGHRFINIFDADAIKSQDRDVKGNIIYSVRQAIRKEFISLRIWLYSRCKNCNKLKKKLISTPLFPA